MSFRFLLYTALFALAQLSLAHTWVEQLSLIDGNGKYAGAYGYPRGFVDRTTSGFNDDMNMYRPLTLASGRIKVDETDLLCHPAQREQNQTANFPRLSAGPGSYIALKYTENGHVTIPGAQPGKPENRGTIFIYATTQPKNDEKIVEVLRWTKDGTGGDKRGRLVSLQNFDDMRCHQISDKPMSIERQKEFPDPIPGQPGNQAELWCETDIALPTDASLIQPGKTLTLYWVWDWPLLPGSPGTPTGKQEWYSTCIDVDVVASPPLGAVTNALKYQDPMQAAVADYKARQVDARYLVPSYFTWPDSTEKYPGGADAPPEPSTAPAATTPPPPPPPPPKPTETPQPKQAFIQPDAGDGPAKPSTASSVLTVSAVFMPGQQTIVVQGSYAVTFAADAPGGVQGTATPTAKPTATAALGAAGRRRRA